MQYKWIFKRAYSEFALQFTKEPNVCVFSCSKSNFYSLDFFCSIYTQTFIFFSCKCLSAINNKNFRSLQTYKCNSQNISLSLFIPPDFCLFHNKNLHIADSHANNAQLQTAFIIANMHTCDLRLSDCE